MSTFVPNMGTVKPQATLANTLFTRTQQAVLRLLFSDTEKSYHLRGIVSASGLGMGAVQRELQRLTEAGVLIREADRSQVTFRVNTQHPVYPELRGLIIKTFGVADVIRAALQPLVSQIDVAFIHGSFAPGTETHRSDVDVIVVGEVDFGDVVAALHPEEDRLNREVNPSVYSRGEFLRKLREQHHFLTTVMQSPRIDIIGNSSELAGLA